MADANRARGDSCNCAARGNGPLEGLVPWHMIRPVKGECVPERVIVFQIAPLRREVQKGVYEDTLLCGHARCYWLHCGEVIREEKCEFGVADRLWEAIARWQVKDRTTWIFAHSLGYQLTLANFWHRLDTPAEQHLWSVLSDPPTIVCTRRGRRVLKYVDTVNYFREPLPVLLGGRAGWSSWALDPRAPVYDTIAWCRRATNALGELICRTIRIMAIELRSTWQCTAASLSWSVYRHWYLGPGIWVHGHADASSLELDALFGGLLQVSRIGAIPSPTRAWDVNSLYPSVMSAAQMPNKLVRYHDDPTVSLMHHCLSRHYCVAEVSVEIPPYPLPYRRDRLAGLSRAAARYVLCGQELRDAARDGMVSACHRLATYETADLFRRFVSDLYPRKVEASERGDLAARWLWKMLLNGLSGKFAQRSRRWTDVKEILCPGRWRYWWNVDPVTGTARRARNIAGRTQLLAEGGLKRDSLPVVTAAITSAGRSALRALTALADTSQCLYTDCDSIHLGVEGSRALVAAGVCDRRRLGALKLVVEGPDAYYWGPKHYRIGDYYVSNLVQIGASRLDDGYYLQQTRRGLELTLQSGVLDRVILREQVVSV